jgi:hypothetical protein
MMPGRPASDWNYCTHRFSDYLPQIRTCLSMIPQCARSFGIAIVFLALLAGRANAWGPNGHKTVAAIAEKLIDGTNAASQVQATLGSTALQDAAVWPDCAKGGVPQGNPPVFSYTGAGPHSAERLLGLCVALADGIEGLFRSTCAGQK